MSQPELTRRDREAVLQELERISDTLGAISTWLSDVDQEQASILVESGWRDLMAACWVIGKPVRTRPEGWLRA